MSTLVIGLAVVGLVIFACFWAWVLCQAATLGNQAEYGCGVHGAVEEAVRKEIGHV